MHFSLISGSYKALYTNTAWNEGYLYLNTSNAVVTVNQVGKTYCTGDYPIMDVYV